MTLQKACDVLNIQYDPQARYSNSHKDMLFEDADRSFKLLIKQHHPDVGGNADMARDLIEAYQFLKHKFEVKRLSVTEWFEIRAERIKERKARARAENKTKQRCPSKPRSSCGNRRRPVVQYSQTGEMIREWESAKLAANAYNIDASTIGKCAKGSKYYHTAAGYVWKYKE